MNRVVFYLLLKISSLPSVIETGGNCVLSPPSGGKKGNRNMKALELFSLVGSILHFFFFFKCSISLDKSYFQVSVTRNDAAAVDHF